MLERWPADFAGGADPLALVDRMLAETHGHAPPEPTSGISWPRRCRSTTLGSLVAAVVNGSGAIYELSQVGRRLRGWRSRSTSRRGSCMPETSGGMIVHGGTIATLTALLAARQAQGRVRRLARRRARRPAARPARQRPDALLHRARRADHGLRRGRRDLGRERRALPHAAGGAVGRDRGRARTRASAPSRWSRPRARRRPARSIRSRRSPTSAPPRACGCTSTRRTAGRPR